MASKNKPHEIISGLGWAVQFFFIFLGVLLTRMDKEEIHRLGTSEGADDMRRFVEAGCDAIAAPEIVPPSDAQIHRLTVRYRPDREWQEAVSAAGPDTSDSYNVRKVGGQYPLGEEGEIEEELILLNYPNGGGSWKKALAWAEETKLVRTVPRELFAIGEQHPNLHRELGVNPMYAVATTDCIFDGGRRACSVWWCDSLREAILHWVGHFGHSHDWFVFRKQNSGPGS